MLEAAAKQAGIKLAAPVRKAILSALSERDETAAICRDADGAPEPDPELRDTESVPLPVGDDPVDADGVPASVRAFFAREVLPHVTDAWIDTAKRDEKDGHVGIIGYEINFNRYFYRYTPPRPLEEIERQIREIEGDIVRMLAEVTGAAR
jgi:type I restriction enzyme M protein